MEVTKKDLKEVYRREVAKEVLPIIIDADRDYEGNTTDITMLGHCRLARKYANFLTDVMFEKE